MAVDQLPLGQTGLAASLRVRYYDVGGDVYNSATGTTDTTWSDASYANYQLNIVAELGTSGVYEWVVPTAVANWDYRRFEVYQVVGGTPSTDVLVGSGENEGTGVSGSDVDRVNL